MFQAIRHIFATSFKWIFAALPSGLRYFYYLRFSLMIWLFPLAISGLNQTGVRTLTSGILVPELWQQYTCVGFFLISSGFTALVIARINVINGEERFSLLSASELDVKEIDVPNGALPPVLLKNLLNNDKSRFEILAVLVSLLPTAGTCWYIVANAAQEGVPYRNSLPGLLFGAVLSFGVWAAVNILYYLLYRIPRDLKPEEKVTIKLGVNAARTILFPRCLFGLPIHGENVSDDTIEAATASVDTGWFGDFIQRRLDAFVQHIGLPGYVYYNKTTRRETDRILEAQFFAMLASGGFALTYIAIGPLSAPVPTLYAPFSILGLLIVLVISLVFLLSVKQKSDGRRPWQASFAAVALTAYALIFPILYYASDSERFPVFASILVAATMLAWLFGGFAYFLDRFRVPVLTFVLVLVVLPRLWPGDKGGEEHYFSIATVDTKPTDLNQPTPAAILAKWLDTNDVGPDKPVIIITATGGGLHASAWTAAVLDHLEKQFKQDDAFKGKDQPFYSNILLISTVSGGSTGALSYLDERQHHREADSALASSACSSLEAVGWGIIYHDLPATLLPAIFWPHGSSNGIDDLAAGPMFDKDRTWALRVGFERNLRDTYCRRQWDSPHTKVWWKTERDDISDARAAEKELTLRSLVVEPGKTPALVMNTTTAEHGSRFLLSNYVIPRYALEKDEALPAQSFLQAFGGENVSHLDAPLYADLPLATAAQLSATFPYVSSAARFPLGEAVRSAHFIDGGYYDNDGTASALEFLRYALETPDHAKSRRQKDCDQLAALDKIGSTFGPGKKRLHVILLEIRNSADDPADDPESDDQARIKPGAKSLLFQLYAPLLGFWNAGHQSVTARNRSAISLIERAYHDSLEIEHIVIADTSHKTGTSNTDVITRTDPLNWSLTPRQRTEIKTAARGADCEKLKGQEKKQCDDIKEKYQRVLDWTLNPTKWPAEQQPSPATPKS